MRSLVLFPLAAIAAPSLAQDPSSGSTAAETPVDLATDEVIKAEGDEILVIATRLRGQVDAPQPPILTLDETDIEAYGAESISDLLTQLSPQTGSGRGRGGGHPVTLVNGRRISSFREIRDLPPEAIRRMEILPEEVALRFGYPPDQRVVNFILKDNFTSRTISAEYEPATDGGTADSELEATVLNIDGQRRLNLTGKINDTSLLTEAERGVIQPQGTTPTVADDPDPATYRSLVSASRSYALNGTWSTSLGEGARAAALTINGAATRTDSRSVDGLDTVRLSRDGFAEVRSLPDPLERRSRATTLEMGLGFNKPLGDGWNLTATADGSYGESRTLTDRPRDLRALVEAAATGTLPLGGPLPIVAPGGVDRSDSKTVGISSLATLAGRPFSLPAGDVSLTIKAGYSYNRSVANDTRTARETRLSRGDASVGVNVGLPVTSRRNDVLAAVGDISLNFSAGIDHLSDFGTIKDWSAGITWAPTERLGLQASYIVNEAAPSLANLGSPAIQSFNVPVFDFARGETALVTITGGGNPALRRETQRDIKLSANWTLPFLKDNSSFILEYFRNRSSDVTQDFPLLTPAIEAAFPARVLRDASGGLVAIDRRPVTFDEVHSSRIRYGINLSGSIGKPQPGDRGGMRRRGPGAAGGFGRGRGGGGPGFGGGFGGRGGNGQGRWNLSVTHTIELTNTVLVAPMAPVLDLLGGDALSAGGVARHGVEFEGGGFYRSFGLRFQGNWSSPVTVRASGTPGSTDLRFGSVARIGLRAFVNFDQRKSIVEAVPFLKGSRLMLKVDNLLNARQRVTDATGTVPLAYQPAYRDPRGRVIGIDFRKMF